MRWFASFQARMLRRRADLWDRRPWMMFTVAFLAIALRVHGQQMRTNPKYREWVGDQTSRLVKS